MPGITQGDIPQGVSPSQRSLAFADSSYCTGQEKVMSEHRGSYIGVIIFAIVLGAVSVLLWLGGEVNIVEKVLIVASVFFCLFLLLKQKWALIGICCTLLAAILVYFIQAWLWPIVTEETGLIMPNVIKMIVGILFFIFIGRQSIEHRLAR
jgi:hypothetical protein